MRSCWPARPRGFEAEEDGLGFGVAEAGVELEDHGAGGGDHDAAEEDSFEGGTFGGHAVDGALGDVGDEPLGELGGHEGVGGVGSHAAGVRAGVAFADALVVLGGGDRDGVGSVAEGEEGELVAGEKFFKDDFGFGCSGELSREDAGGHGLGFDVRVADDDAFAGGEAAGLDDDGGAEAVELFVDLFKAGAEGVGRGGDVVAAHEVLGEGLAGFEHGGGLGGAEDAATIGGKCVDEAEGERHFGADDRDGRVDDGYEVEEGWEAGYVDGETLCDLGYAAVAGGAKDFGDAGGVRERPADGVLAATAALFFPNH